MTGDQLADADRLRVAYQAWKSRRSKLGLPSSQGALGDAAGDYSQSTVSQYMTGQIVLNARALADFAIAMEIDPSTISPRLTTELRRMAQAVNISVTDNSEPANSRFDPENARYQPGLVYAWDEIVRIYQGGAADSIPDVFSVEMHDDSMAGRAGRGDIVTISKADIRPAVAGDGVLLKTSSGAYMLRSYKPKGDGTFRADPFNNDYLPLESDRDGLTVLGVLVGVPSCRWSRR